MGISRLLALFLACCTLGSARAASFQITEFLAANSGSLRDEDGDSSDWIELHNPGTDTAFLDGWFLTDDSFDLTKWRFPEGVEMQPNSYRLVFASGKNRTNSPGRLHANFRLSAEGEYLALADPNGNIVSEFAPFFPEQSPNVSFGRDVADPSLLAYFPQPTPGQRNATGGPGFAPEVSFSRASGTFPMREPFYLTLSAYGSNVTIRYAFGTNLPSLLYTNPILITNSTIVRARSMADALLPGPMDSRTYLALADDVVNFNSDLPLMIVHNFGQGEPTVNNQNVAVQTFEPDPLRTFLTGAASQTERGRFHFRGSTSALQPKKPFFLEIQDEFGADKESSLLGLPEESDWVLYAPFWWYDPPMMHNALAYQLMRDFGRYAPRTKYVELFLKDDWGSPGPITAADYHGVYMLTEKIKRDDNRVAIDELEPEHLAHPEITGGYLFSRDQSRTDDGPSLAFGDAVFSWISPRAREMSNALRRPQVEYITNYLWNLSSVLNSPDWTNPISGYTSLIDRDSWIDYHVHQVITMNVDTLVASMYFYKPRGGKLTFGPPWDFDRSQGQATNGSTFNPLRWATSRHTFDPQSFLIPWWPRLFRDPDFWQRWVDRYQELRESALSTNSILGHIDNFANQISEAQRRDERTWGSVYRSGVVASEGFSYNFGNPGAYTNEVAFQKFWYLNRLNFLDTNFLPRPTISQTDGLVQTNTPVTISPATKPGTVLFYTLDGSDPRMSSGGLNPMARSNAGPVSLSVVSDICIAARSYNPNHANTTGGDGPPLTTPWSGIARVRLHVAIPALRVTELMYNPEGGDSFEFARVLNTGDTALDLGGFRITGGIEFQFPSVELAAGATAFVVADEIFYRERYGESNLVIGSYTGRLENGGERIQLLGPCDEPILDFQYDDDWYPITDGFGLSLVIVDPEAPLPDWNLKAQWRSSGAVRTSAVVINELLSHSAVPPPYDSVELHNASDVQIDISHWYLSDDFRTPRKYQFPEGTVIGARGYVVFDETSFNSGNIAGEPFSFSSLGDEAYIFSADVDGALTGYLHGFRFGAQEDGVTFGRHVDDAGHEHFVRQSERTLGAMNSGTEIGPVVISEIMYRPRDSWRGTDALDNRADEYIELRNIAPVGVALSHPEYPLNRWRVAEGISYEFPPGISMPPNGLLLLVSFDANDPGLVAAFRSRYDVPSSVPIFGPYTGKLDNSGERVLLQKPDVPRPGGPPDFGVVPYPVVEEVNYRDSMPWPEAADGYGASLQRIAQVAFSDDPASWVAAVPSPGRIHVNGSGPLIIQQPAVTSVVEYANCQFRVEASGTGHLNFHWRFNGQAIPHATNATLLLTNVQMSQEGMYDVVIADAANSLVSDKAKLTVIESIEIVQHPASQAIAAGSNVTFTAIAEGSGPIRYQWNFNGTNIPGASDATLIINNITNIHEGSYRVIAANALSSRQSQPAYLTVLLAPRLVAPVPPLRITATTNQAISLGAETLGTLPMYYRWRRFSPSGAPATISNVALNSRTHFATFSLAGLTNGDYVYALSFSNVVRPGLNIAWTNAFVRIVADTDGDRITDEYELAHGFRIDDPMDALADPDSDGVSNLEEFLAGTDPHDLRSVLTIDNLTVLPPPIIRFNAISNRTYSLEYSDDSLTGDWHWLADVLPQSSNRVELIHDPSPATNRYYRLRTPRGP